MKDYFFNLLAFDYWTNVRLMESMQAAVDIPQRAKDLFNHLIATTRVWRSRMVGEMQDVEVWEKFEEQHWPELLDHNYQLMTSFLEQLQEEDLQRKIRYYNTKGVAYETVISDILTHLIVHSGYHQGQIVSLTKPFFSTDPDLMYITYTREQK
ncbi:DinB family protein [Pedobacter sp. N36a]|uniref:DinB family protein n=1 Tax=Pedobacter sp. N36a TaxID=2767996 RepID=UPI001656DA31|nr:DinB family protein [Pedobacter sp. N36a]MBC8984208.1 DinB family protein [Pedobacter sp. N36a]